MGIEIVKGSSNSAEPLESFDELIEASRRSIEVSIGLMLGGKCEGE